MIKGNDENNPLGVDSGLDIDSRENSQTNSQTNSLVNSPRIADKKAESDENTKNIKNEQKSHDRSRRNSAIGGGSNKSEPTLLHDSSRRTEQIAQLNKLLKSSTLVLPLSQNSKITYRDYAPEKYLKFYTKSSRSKSKSKSSVSKNNDENSNESPNSTELPKISPQNSRNTSKDTNNSDPNNSDMNNSDSDFSTSDSDAASCNEDYSAFKNCGPTTSIWSLLRFLE